MTTLSPNLGLKLYDPNVDSASLVFNWMSDVSGSSPSNMTKIDTYVGNTAASLTIVSASLANVSSASYIVFSSSSSLSNEKVLTAGSNISIESSASVVYVHNTSIVPAADGWTSANATWTYVSASAISLASASSILIKGDKLKYTASGSTIYQYVTGFGSGSVALVTGGTDYPVPNAVITNNYYSHQSSPMGFPNLFNYTPVGTNIWGTGLAYTGEFSLNGRTVYVKVKVTGTSASSTLGISTLTCPPGLVPLTQGTCAATNSFVANLGIGLIAGSTIFPPAWPATASVFITGTYLS